MGYRKIVSKLKEQSELIIDGHRGMARSKPMLNVILLGREFKEDEAERCLTHETLHILVFELEGIFAYKELDKATRLFYGKFEEDIEGF